MANQLELQFIGFKEFEAAVKRNPAFVKSRASHFLVKGIQLYNQSIIRQPWRMGGSGGGVPVDTGNLRDTHKKEMKSFEASIRPTSPYASYVHGLNGKTRNVRGVQLRPWLDYAKQKNESGIRSLYLKFLEEVTKDLAK